MTTKKNNIQVFEHEKLTLSTDLHGRAISQKQLDKLLKFKDKNKNKYFTPIRNGVKFNQFVGVIQIGRLTIEILPKTDKKGFENDDKTNVWRNVLLQMLQLSGNLSLESVSEANLKKRHNSLLDLYFEKYIKEVESLLRKGLIKKYRNQSSNLTTLKGRLDFASNIQKNLIHKERFYTHHQHYDFNHLLNQILQKGLQVLYSVSNNTTLKSKLKKILFAFPEIKEIEITKSSFDKIILDRKSEKYEQALQIAKMIILNYSPDISKGQENMLAILFDMNMLWENYIYRILKRAKNSEYSVSYHRRKTFWKNRYIEPDIIVKKGNETFIIDTKWKLISQSNPSLQDLKQIYVYNMYWNASKSMLLYPQFEQQSDGSWGVFEDFHTNDTQCKIGFINILNKNNNSLNYNIADNILKKLSKF